MEVDPRLAEAGRLESAGFTHLRSKDYPQAVCCFEQAAALCLAASDRKKGCELLNYLADVQLQMGFPEQALTTYDRLLAVLTEEAEPLSRAQVLHNMGLLLARQRNFQRVLAAFQDAERSYRIAGDERGAAAEQGNQGSVCRDLGRFEEALAHYQEAVAVFRRLDDAQGIAEQCINIVYIHLRQGKLQEAQDWYVEALPYCRRSERRELLEAVRANIERLQEALSTGPR
jgi:tetratricopeptide (TPR) repeat protein